VKKDREINTKGEDEDSSEDSEESGNNNEKKKKKKGPTEDKMDKEPSKTAETTVFIRIFRVLK